MIAIPLALLFAALQAAPADETPPAVATAAPTASSTAVPVSPGPVSPQPTSSAAATPTAAAIPTTATATPAPTVSAAPTITATPAPTATPEAYEYRFVPRQPDHPAPGQPQIFAVYLNSKNLKSLGPIDIKVATTPNVVKVLTRSNGHEGTVPMIAPGDFEAKSKLPKLPLIASGISTTLNFIAIGANGQRVTVPVPVVLQ